MFLIPYSIMLKLSLFSFKGLGDVTTELAGGPEEEDAGGQHGQAGADEEERQEHNRDNDEELKLLALKSSLSLDRLARHFVVKDGNAFNFVQSLEFRKRRIFSQRPRAVPNTR